MLNTDCFKYVLFFCPYAPWHLKRYLKNPHSSGDTTRYSFRDGCKVLSIILGAGMVSSPQHTCTDTPNSNETSRNCVFCIILQSPTQLRGCLPSLHLFSSPQTQVDSTAAKMTSGQRFILDIVHHM